MRKLYLACASMLLAFAVSGCFGTQKPLFDAKSAVYPIPNGAHYIQYFDEGSGFKEYARGTIALKDGWYVATNKAPKTEVITFMLKQWGKNYLAINKSQDDKGALIYVYGILKPDAGAFFEYGPECNKLGAEALKKKGLVTYKPGQEDACAPVSVEALGTVMQMILDTKAQPDNKYVLVK